MPSVVGNTGLDVDLSSGAIRTFEVPADLLARYLGGRGLGVQYLARELSPGADPLSAENMLVFAAGGLGGSMAPTGGRFSVTFKSPLTGTIASANSGGFWGSSFKRTGHDVLIIRGRAASPVYLFISESECRLHEAADLWGMSVPELSHALQERFSHPVNIMGIGPAGENRVLFAAIMNENSRALARCGPGAVMGAKNLKAVVVHGRRQFQPVHREQYQAGLFQANKLIRSLPVTARALKELGTAGLVKLICDHDMLPHLNFSDVAHSPADLENISGEALRREILVSPKPCFNCRISCGRRTRVNGREGEGPEYETIALLGPNLGIYDIREVALANYACNDLGLDTISLGGTLGIAMELFQKGILPGQETGGLEIRFGKKGILEDLARMTGLRRGFGDVLAEGALRLGIRYGAPNLAMAVKGLELPGYEPRATMAQALGYATSPRGGCHLQGGYAITLGFFGGSREVDRFLIDTTAGHVVNQQDSGCVADSLGICRFSFFSLAENELSRIFYGYTGIDLSPHDLELAARRIQDRERRWNSMAGFSRADDTLPDRMFQEKIMIAGQMRAIDRESHFEPLLRKYYEIRGWDEKGMIRQEEV